MDEFDTEEPSMADLLRAEIRPLPAPLPDTLLSPLTSSLLAVAHPFGVAIAAWGNSLYTTSLRATSASPVITRLPGIAIGVVCPSARPGVAFVAVAGSGVTAYDVAALVRGEALEVAPVAAGNAVSLAAVAGGDACVVVFGDGDAGICGFGPRRILHAAAAGQGAAISAAALDDGVLLVAVGTQKGAVCLYRGDELVGSVKEVVSDWRPQSLHFIDAKALLVTYQNPGGEMWNVVMTIDGGRFESTDPAMMVHLGEVCYPSFDEDDGSKEVPVVLAASIPSWDLVVVASSVSADIEVLGLGAAEAGLVSKDVERQRWRVWKLSEDATIALPSAENFAETFPIGIALDLTDNRPVPAAAEGEAPLKPMPCLLVLTSKGLLVRFTIADNRSGVECAAVVDAETLPTSPVGVGDLSTTAASSGAVSAESAFASRSLRRPRSEASGDDARADADSLDSESSLDRSGSVKGSATFGSMAFPHSQPGIAAAGRGNMQSRKGPAVGDSDGGEYEGDVSGDDENARSESGGFVFKQPPPSQSASLKYGVHSKAFTGAYKPAGAASFGTTGAYGDSFRASSKAEDAFTGSLGKSPASYLGQPANSSDESWELASRKPETRFTSENVRAAVQYAPSLGAQPVVSSSLRNAAPLADGAFDVTEVKRNVESKAQPNLSHAVEMASQTDSLSQMKSILSEMVEELASVSRVSAGMNSLLDDKSSAVSDEVRAVLDRIAALRSTIRQHGQEHEQMHGKTCDHLKEVMALGRDVGDVTVLVKSNGSKNGSRHRNLPPDVQELDRKLDAKELEVAGALASIEARVEPPVNRTVCVNARAASKARHSPWNQNLSARSPSSSDIAQQLFSSLSLQGARIKRVLAMLGAMEAQFDDHSRLLRGRKGSDIGLSQARLEKLSLSGSGKRGRGSRTTSSAGRKASESVGPRHRSGTSGVMSSTSGVGQQGKSLISQPVQRVNRLSSDTCDALRAIAMKDGRECVTVHPLAAASISLLGSRERAEEVRRASRLPRSAAGGIGARNFEPVSRRGSGGLYTSTKHVRGGGHAVVADEEPSLIGDPSGRRRIVETKSPSMSTLTAGVGVPQKAFAEGGVSGLKRFGSRPSAFGSGFKEAQFSGGTQEPGKRAVSISSVDSKQKGTFEFPSMQGSGSAASKEQVGSGFAAGEKEGASSLFGLSAGHSSFEPGHESKSSTDDAAFTPKRNLQASFASKPPAFSPASAPDPGFSLDLTRKDSVNGASKLPSFAFGAGTGAGLFGGDNSSKQRNYASFSSSSFINLGSGPSKAQKSNVELKEGGTFPSLPPLGSEKYVPAEAVRNLPVAEANVPKAWLPPDGSENDVSYSNQRSQSSVVQAAPKAGMPPDGSEIDVPETSLPLSDPERNVSKATAAGMPPSGSEFDVPKVMQPTFGAKKSDLTAKMPPSGTETDVPNASPPLAPFSIVPKAGMPPSCSEIDVPKSSPPSSKASVNIVTARMPPSVSENHVPSASPRPAPVNVVPTAGMPPSGSEIDVPKASPPPPKGSVAPTAGMPPSGSEIDVPKVNSPMPSASTNATAKAGMPPSGSESDVPNAFLPPSDSEKDVPEAARPPSVPEHDEAKSSPPSGIARTPTETGAQFGFESATQIQAAAKPGESTPGNAPFSFPAASSSSRSQFDAPSAFLPPSGPEASAGSLAFPQSSAALPFASRSQTAMFGSSSGFGDSAVTQPATALPQANDAVGFGGANSRPGSAFGTSSAFATVADSAISSSTPGLGFSSLGFGSGMSGAGTGAVSSHSPFVQAASPFNQTPAAVPAQPVFGGPDFSNQNQSIQTQLKLSPSPFSTGSSPQTGSINFGGSSAPFGSMPGQSSGFGFPTASQSSNGFGGMTQQSAASVAPVSSSFGGSMGSVSFGSPPQLGSTAPPAASVGSRSPFGMGSAGLPSAGFGQQSSFGQSSFGQSSAIGNAGAGVMGAAFGQPPTFGSNAPPLLGQGQSTSGHTFGALAAAQPTTGFGAQTNTGFGAQTNNGFGTPPSGFTAQAAQNSPLLQAPLFGQTANASQVGFGNFGQPQQSPSGTSDGSFTSPAFTQRRG